MPAPISASDRHQHPVDLSTVGQQSLAINPRVKIQRARGVKIQRAPTLQEDEFRKHHAKLLEDNARHINSLIKTGKVRRQDREHRPVAGTLLLREYRGTTHEVIVTHDGQFEYQGRPYPSLSMIAREITGTRWSGPLFFGLKAPSAKGKTPAGGRT